MNLLFKNYKRRYIHNQIIFHILKFKKNSKIVKFREIIGADEIAFDNEIYKIPCGSIYRWPYKIIIQIKITSKISIF